MKGTRFWIVPLLCVALLLGTGCQRKGIIPCPKPGKTKLFGKKSSGAPASGVTMDKKGYVKKKKGIF